MDFAGGGGEERGGGAVGADKVLVMLNGGKGGTKRFGVVSTQELEVLAMLIGGGGGAKRLHPFKKKGGGAEKVLTYITEFRTSEFPIF